MMAATEWQQWVGFVIALVVLPDARIGRAR